MNLSRALLPMLLIALALGAGCTVPPAPIFRPGLDRERVSRVGFRPEGKTLRPYSVLVQKNVIPPGTPSRVSFYSSQELRVKLNNMEYVMLPLTGEAFPVDEKQMDAFLDKYFVDKDVEVDIDAMGPEDLSPNVLTGQHVIGMTKEQVYAALGPPIRINRTQSAAGLPRDEILASDQWAYVHNWVLAWPNLLYLYFGDGRLQKQAQ